MTSNPSKQDTLLQTIVKALSTTDSNTMKIFMRLPCTRPREHVLFYISRKIRRKTG